MVDVILVLYSTAGGRPQELLATRLVQLPGVPRAGEEIEYAIGRVTPVHQVFWRSSDGTVEVIITIPGNVGNDELVAAGYQLKQ